MRHLLPACVVAALAGCEAPPPALPPGIPIPPDVRAELAVEALDDVVAVVDDLGAAGLVPIPPGRLSRSGLEAAGIEGPVAVALRPAGGVVVSAGLKDPARLQLALGQVLPDAGLRRRRVLGQVDALVDDADATAALLRAGSGLLLVVLGPKDPLAEAAMLEALATGAVTAPRRQPRGMAWRVVPGGPPAELVDGPLEGTLERRAHGLMARATVPIAETPAGRALVDGLSSSGSSASCVVDEDALAVLHLPAVAGLGEMVDDEALASLPGSLDAFDGRLTIALLPPLPGTPSRPDDLPSLAGLALVGRPRAGAAAALQAQIDEAIGGAPVERRVVGAREVRTVGPADAPWRRLSAVVGDDVFAVGLGAPVVVDRVAAGARCPPSTRLLSVKGPAVLALVERAAPELRLVRRLAGWSGADDPLAILRGVEGLAVDASATGRAVALEVDITLARRAPRAGGG